MYDIEKIWEPESVQQAISILESNPQAVVICGGSDVLIRVREGRLAGCSLVSIQALRELQHITLQQDGTLHIGPGCTFAQVHAHPLITEHLPVLGLAVDQAGGPQLRNIGTIGGNICNGATSADSASTLFALNARLLLQGPQGTRLVPIQDFYKGPGKVDLLPAELLVSIQIAKQDYEGYFGHYIKYAQRNAMDIATLGCAAVLRLAPDNATIADLRLAFGVAAPTPVRCPQTEQLAKGQPLSEDLLHKLGQTAITEVTPRTSWRASKEFRLQLVQELTQRAIRTAAQQAKGEYIA